MEFAPSPPLLLAARGNLPFAFPDIFSQVESINRSLGLSEGAIANPGFKRPWRRRSVV